MWTEMFRWTAVVLLAGLVAGCERLDSSPAEGAQPAPSHSSPAPPDRDLPRAGACYDTVSSDADSGALLSDEVACSERHNAYTMWSVALPEKNDADVQGSDLFADTSYECHRSVVRLLGGPEAQAVSLFRATAILASPLDFNRGHGWARCDVTIEDPTAPALLPLPRSLRGVLDHGVPDRWRKCIHTDKTPIPDLVPCTRRHDARAVGAVRLPSVETPGTDAFDGVADEACGPVLQDWASRAGRGTGRGYFWYADQFATRPHERPLAVCIAVTTR